MSHPSSGSFASRSREQEASELPRFCISGRGPSLSDIAASLDRHLTGIEDELRLFRERPDASSDNSHQTFGSCMTSEWQPGPQGPAGPDAAPSLAQQEIDRLRKENWALWRWIMVLMVVQLITMLAFVNLK